MEDIQILSPREVNGLDHNYVRRPFSPRNSSSDDTSEDPPTTEDSSDGFSFSFSEDDLIPTETLLLNSDFNDFSSRSYLAAYDKDSDILYSKPVDDPVEARITVQRTLLVSDPADTLLRDPSPNPEPPTKEERKSRRSSRSLSGFGRRSKSAKRGSKSPTKQPADDPPPHQADEVRSRPSRAHSRSSKRDKSRPRRSPTREDQDNASRGARSFISRKTNLLSKKSHVHTVDAAPHMPSPQSPQVSVSPAKHPTSPAVKSDLNNAATPSKKQRSALISPLPGTVLDRVNRKPQSPLPKKKDELWNTFRSLESDYHKFEDKPITMKASFVRTALLPFLQNYASHPSNYNIQSEDLDRRVKILDKWWKALLLILDGQSGYNITAFDRLSIMDGISGIMERPEWRQPPSEFASLKHRFDSKVPESKLSSPDSEPSDEAQYSSDSIHLHARHTFMQNLFRQMSIVVDKMSARTVAASLVSFCGKCCAYAFFFCAGMADVMARLWRIPARNLKRATDNSVSTRSQNLTDVSRRVLALFPECMHGLEFSSSRAAVLNLRAKPVLPLGFEKFSWRDPAWTDRWCGNESDLFYVFVRHFHCLMADFLPEDPSREEIACVPGYMLLRAQLLSTIDSTFRRFDRANPEELKDGISPSMLDEMINADGLAIAPLPTNAFRMITENRVVILLRTFLAQSSVSDLAAQKLFADCVCDLMKAAACSTSLFDQGACFTVCDLLQEVLAILGKFEEQTQATTSLDWDFWLCCFAQMGRSDNTLTLIRVVALIFSTWPYIAARENRKSDLCLKFVLDDDIFPLYFLHWCPMVRSYFMRLLAWRLARYDGDATSDDIEIYKLLLDRLLEIWGFFKHVANEADERGLPFPSTAPCNPAPGRRLLIIRTDNAFTGLSTADAIAEPDSPLQTARAEQNGKANVNPGSSSFSASQLLEKLSATLEQGIDTGRRKSGLFRSMISPRPSEARATSDAWSAHPSVEPGAQNRVSSPPNSMISSRTSLYEQRPMVQQDAGSRPKTAGMEKSNSRERMNAAPARQAEFRFSVEPGDRRPNKLPKEMSLGAPKLPHAVYSLLQSSPGFVGDVDAARPETEVAVSGIRYGGRALAEWALVVNECQNFFERRKKEGVPTSKQVETPIMSTEPFRRFG